MAGWPVTVKYKMFCPVFHTLDILHRSKNFKLVLAKTVCGDIAGYFLYIYLAEFPLWLIIHVSDCFTFTLIEHFLFVLHLVIFVIVVHWHRIKSEISRTWSFTVALFHHKIYNRFPAAAEFYTEFLCLFCSVKVSILDSLISQH